MAPPRRPALPCAAPSRRPFRSPLLPATLLGLASLAALAASGIQGPLCFAAAKSKGTKAVKEAPTEPPKRPLTAYFLWLNENRAAIQKELGIKSVAEVGKKAGEQWRGLAPKKKATYETQAAKLKEEYDEELASFLANGGVIEKKTRTPKGTAPKAPKAPKDPNAPKRPAGGAYGVYLAKHREEIKKSLPKDHKVTDVIKEAGARWSKLTEAMKKPYQKEYEEKMEAYKAAVGKQ